MSKPKSYDIDNAEDLQRLFFELKSYMRVSLFDGTDRKGRQYAYDALCEITKRIEEDAKGESE